MRNNIKKTALRIRIEKNRNTANKILSNLFAWYCYNIEIPNTVAILIGILFILLFPIYFASVFTLYLENIYAVTEPLVHSETFDIDSSKTLETSSKINVKKVIFFIIILTAVSTHPHALELIMKRLLLGGSCLFGIDTEVGSNPEIDVKDIRIDDRDLEVDVEDLEVNLEDDTSSTEGNMEGMSRDLFTIPEEEEEVDKSDE